MDTAKSIIEPLTAAMTTAKATFLGMGISMSALITQENVIFALTVAVLTCQLASWAYKAYKWWKRSGDGSA